MHQTDLKMLLVIIEAPTVVSAYAVDCIMVLDSAVSFPFIRLCMCTCICIYVYVYIYMYEDIQMHISVCVYACYRYLHVAQREGD